MLQLDVMSAGFVDQPSLDGPEYMSLIIEWDALADDLERKLRHQPGSLTQEVEAPRSWSRTLKIAAGALGVAVLAWRIVRKLRA